MRNVAIASLIAIALLALVGGFDLLYIYVKNPFFGEQMFNKQLSPEELLLRVKNSVERNKSEIDRELDQVFATWPLRDVSQRMLYKPHGGLLSLRREIGGCCDSYWCCYQDSKRPKLLILRFGNHSQYAFISLYPEGTDVSEMEWCDMRWVSNNIGVNFEGVYTASGIVWH